jgi:inhibitor of cysteine peptidase
MTQEGPEVIEVRAGDTFEIALESVPATGYTWQEEHASSLLELLRANDFRAASDAVGAGGKEAFEFQALAPGETEIRFQYGRPWDEAAADERRYRVRISD